MLTSVLRDLRSGRGPGLCRPRCSGAQGGGSRASSQPLGQEPRAGPTDEEVEDGHVDDVEQPRAAVVRVDLLHGVAVKRIDLPPEGENQSWGWKSQDGKVLGALLTPVPAPKSLPP